MGRRAGKRGLDRDIRECQICRCPVCKDTPKGYKRFARKRARQRWRKKLHDYDAEE